MAPRSLGPCGPTWRATAAALTARGVRPGLAVVLVGDDPASAVYVRSKGKASEEAGMHSVTMRLPSATTRGGAAARTWIGSTPIASIHGILVQMPLPKHISAEVVIRRVLPGEGCGRVSSGQRREAAERRHRRIRAVYAGRGAGTAGAVRRGDQGGRVRDRRPQHDRGKADGLADDAGPSRRQRDGHRVPQPHRRPGGSHEAGRHPDRRCGATRNS